MWSRRRVARVRNIPQLLDEVRMVWSGERRHLEKYSERDRGWVWPSKEFCRPEDMFESEGTMMREAFPTK